MFNQSKKLLKLIPSFFLLVLIMTSTSQASQIGFIEDFSLAENRLTPLEQLIPGTEDYYYYHCLHYLNVGFFDKCEKYLKLWIKRYGRTDEVREIEHRIALLDYKNNPGKSLEYLRRNLNIYFNHEKEIKDRKPNRPTRLNPDWISRKTLMEKTFRYHSQTVNGFEDSAFEWLIKERLSGDRLRHLLKKLDYPYYPDLAKLICKDLRHEHSRDFGSLSIHKKLLLSQLNECLQIMPDLLNQTKFIQVYLTRLYPDNDVILKKDPKENQEFLTRLLAFTSKLNHSHNSLKAHVLYNFLAFEQSKGIYDKEKFMAYIKLPRRTSYINHKYINHQDRKHYQADLNHDFRHYTSLKTIRNDEKLVSDYLGYFFLKEDNFNQYLPYINDIFLKELFAETKILNGLGDMEQWYSMLPPAKYQALKEKIIIDFAPANKTIFKSNEAVSLDLEIKNVKNLIVKIFEINTRSYYQKHKSEVKTNIDLDGLIPNKELVFDYKDNPLLLTKQHIELPGLDKRGVYVVDFIGNGKSSRALIKKGKLWYLQRIGVAGHVLTVFDEQNKPVPDAGIQLAGHNYKPGKNGIITIPFTNNPQTQPIIISHNDFASLGQLNHEQENYSLKAGIYIDRESLLKQKKANVIIRAQLLLNNTPVTLKILEQPDLTIRSIDIDGIESVKEIKNISLSQKEESIHEFGVPDRLQQIIFTLSAKVKNLSQDKEIVLKASKEFSLNLIETTQNTESLHLSHLRDTGKNIKNIFAKNNYKYVLDLLGKTGEPEPLRLINLRIKHRDFTDPVTCTLQTDSQGRIFLGSLPEIQYIEVTAPDGTTSKWNLLSDKHNYPDDMNGLAGQTLSIPYMGKQKSATSETVALLEVRNNNFYKDWFKAISLENSFINIKGLPAGDYLLFLKEKNSSIKIKLAGNHQDLKAIIHDDYILSANRQLEKSNPQLQIQSINYQNDSIKIKLLNNSELSRVHIIATRYMPAYQMFENLNGYLANPFSVNITPKLSIYLSGRNIGDEYRYIIERQYAKKYPGNMLKRPELLLNPWVVSDTKTKSQKAMGGDDYLSYAPEPECLAEQNAGYYGQSSSSVSEQANLDFLAHGSRIYSNLKADKDGIIIIKRNDIEPYLQLHVLAMDPDNTVYREFALNARETDRPEITDLRLKNGLSHNKHYTEQKNISVILPDSSFQIEDAATARFENYDSLEKVFRLFATLNENKNLNRFSFIINWPKLSEKEKAEKYSKYSCHELNFFLYKKDESFFKDVILPYITNKKEKTFLDYWFLASSTSADGKARKIIKLNDFLEPWAFGRLNIFERILLGQVINDPKNSRHIKELNDLIPPDIESFNTLFSTALKSSSLDADNEYSKIQSTMKLDMPVEAMFDLEEDEVSEEVQMEAPRRPAKKLYKQEEKSSSRKKSKAKRARKSPAAPASMSMDAFDAKEMADLGARKNMRQFYKKLDKTKEYAENNYYKLPIEQQKSSLITVNNFWNDYAGCPSETKFYSNHLAEASNSFTEMILALSVLELPFKSKNSSPKLKQKQLIFNNITPSILFHKEIKEVKESEKSINNQVLINQNFFLLTDRYYYENNEQFDKYVTEEFIINNVYGCQVVITNPTSTRQKLDILLEIPEGAIPVSRSKYTSSVHYELEAYGTTTIEYYFYFPLTGQFQHFPVHIAKDQDLINFSKPFLFNVKEKLSKIDKASWDYISQHGTEKDVLTYLKNNNLQRLDLDKIAWRMKKKSFANSIFSLLLSHHVYNHTLWSYAIKHNDPKNVSQYLQHSDNFIQQCGDLLKSPLVKIDPVIRHDYQHLEYSPLVNSRVHKLGKKPAIQNDRFHHQYRKLLKVLSYLPVLDDNDLMSVTYYLLLQDRIEEAISFFSRINPNNLKTKIQYDYFKIYIDFYSLQFKEARKTASQYLDYPVVRWQKLFTEAVRQLDEIQGLKQKTGIEKSDNKDLSSKHTDLSKLEPGLDFKISGKTLKIHYQNISSIQINYYLMDIELLFSRNPFVQEFSGQFASIKPNKTQVISLPEDKTNFDFILPEDAGNNVMIEIASGAIRKSKAFFANSLNIQIIENYGQVQVTSAQTEKPLSGAYIKVYGRTKDGRIIFYKDGYTDPRGRFDYSSLNTNELDTVDRFAILVMSDKNGAVVKETAPPKR
jgi:hypothetical protein